MGSAEERLSPREAALLIIDAADGRVSGRTVMQKLAYFSSRSLDQDLGHGPHLFGPFSRALEDDLTIAAMSGEVHETVERFPSWRAASPDVRQYTYELTESGRDEVERLKVEHGEAAEKIQMTVEKIDGAVKNRDQKTLSTAAKLDLITRRQGGAVDLNAVPDLAKEFGWELSAEQVQATAEVLESLGLAKVSK